MSSVTWGIISLALLLIISGFLSSARAALSTARRQVLREMGERGNRRAALALTVAEDSTRVLSTFRLANLLTHFLVAGVLAVLVLSRVVAWLQMVAPLSLPLAYGICYLVIIPIGAVITFLLSETLPEIIVGQDPTEWAMRLAGMAQLTVSVLSPLVIAVTTLRRTLAGPFGSDVDRAALVTEEEIMTLVDAGEEEGSIELEEKEMIYSIFQLDETLAREIMVPRIDIFALEIGTPLEEALKAIIEAGHSRIPVYQESLDKISGLLYAKDLLEIWRDGQSSVDLARILRPALFVPESKRVSDLLHELQNAKVHMAVVIDEYGGTAGVVTIEDIVEEIVGEIFDEYDEAAEDTYEVISSDEYIFDARIDLDDFNRLLDSHLTDELGDTLAGFIYGQLGKVPDEGEQFETDRLQIEVLTVVDRRIRKVRVKRLTPDEAALTEEEHDKERHNSNGNGHSAGH